MEYHLGQHVQHDDLLGASLDRLECYVPVPDSQDGAVAVVAEGAEGPAEEEEEDAEEEEEDAEAAFLVLVEQGKEVAVQAGRASSSV